MDPERWAIRIVILLIVLIIIACVVYCFIPSRPSQVKKNNVTVKSGGGLPECGYHEKHLQNCRSYHRALTGGSHGENLQTLATPTTPSGKRNCLPGGTRQTAVCRGVCCTGSQNFGYRAQGGCFSGHSFAPGLAECKANVFVNFTQLGCKDY